MASVLPPSSFTYLYHCGHVRVFEVREITAKFVDFRGPKPGAATEDLKDKEVGSPSGKIDLGTLRMDKVLAAPTTESDLQVDTRRVKWAPQEASPSSLSPTSPTSTYFSTSSSISSRDPLYFHPSKAFKQDVDCPACVAKGKEHLSEDSEEVSGPFDGEEQASSFEDTSDGEVRSRDVEEKVNGWWNMLDLEQYNENETDSDSESESDCHLGGEAIDPLEMV
ncbi:MAG: hypothetical protein L6R37_001841 [Teloschistes peruensis]|nr:MAG: hypothetical protein L6R37_001841 [Teloschistes peruensis]